MNPILPIDVLTPLLLLAVSFLLTTAKRLMPAAISTEKLIRYRPSWGTLIPFTQEAPGMLFDMFQLAGFDRTR